MSETPKRKMRFPKAPRHPERICWGCDKLCPVTSLQCGNGQDRAQHPIEVFGEDWYESLSEDELKKIDLV